MEYRRSNKGRSVALWRLLVTFLSMGCFVAGGELVANGVEFELERSSDLERWENVPVTPDMLTEEGALLLPERLAPRENSAVFRLRDRSNDPIPEGFVRIPTGTYTQGLYMRHGGQRYLYMNDVHVSEFYMAKTTVTYEEWKDVYDWAIQNRYTFHNAGTRGSGPEWTGLPDTPENNRHPVVDVNYYDVLKWCNAKSEREGLTPVYYTSDTKLEPFRTGVHDSDRAKVRWDANGYRLPTTTEWEKGARGGLHQKDWPWGDARIDGAMANYFDSSESNGTTPVGNYPPNPYGLYDMAGNVWEWCWGNFSRGGSARLSASSSSLWSRSGAGPFDVHYARGFRIVKTD